MDNESEILEWASRQVSLVVGKFSAKSNLPVFFNDLDALELNIPYPIPEATESVRCGILILTSVGVSLKTIDYRFYRGAVLLVHHHPDYTECFDIKKGSMIDEISGIEKHEGDYFEIIPHTPHQWRCTDDAHMIINCKKVL
jgi:quercetin dioxygenase-like cupin family protein